MMRERATCITIRGNEILFVQQMVNGQSRNVFVGGGIEENETPQETALRELKEETNVDGEIIFGPAIIEKKMKEYVFVVRIADYAQPTLGYDPELPLDKQEIKSLNWLDTIEDIGLFNKFDCAYFQAIIDESKSKEIKEYWVAVLENIILHNTAK